MKLDDSTLAKLQADPVSETIILIENLFDEVRSLGQETGWNADEHRLLVEATALVEELIDSRVLDVKVLRLTEITGDIPKDCSAAMKFLTEVLNNCQGLSAKDKYESQRARFRIALGTGFSYEFSTGDLQRVQELINLLREQLLTVRGLDEPHRQRLIKRLEKLQSELHKKMSDLDRFWGLIGDAGVVLGKLGNDAKPIVDRVREIADIVWQTQSRTEELPSGTKPPLLEGKQTDSSSNES